MEYKLYNSLTRMFMWCAGHSYECVYYQVDGYCHVMTDYNYNERVGNQKLICVGVRL